MPKGYSLVQIGLHWAIAVLILAQFVFADGMEGAWRALSRGEVPAADVMVQVHVIGGIAVLVLALWRIAILRKRGAPEAPARASALMSKAASLGHLVLYALMLALPISGLAAWFGGVGAAAEAHQLLKVAMIAVVGLHVAAALFHQFYLKDDLMMRMKKPQT